MTAMRGSFVERLGHCVVNAGLVRLTEGILGVLVLAGGLSTLFGTAAIKVGAVVALTVGNLGLIAVLAADRISRRDRDQLHHDLVARYCALLMERLDYAWRIIRWNEVIVVRRNGDASVVIFVSALIECDDMYFFEIYHGSNWDQPSTHRRTVRATMRSLEVDGVGGARQRVTTFWNVDGILHIVAHFREPLIRNSELNLVVELDWPGMCLPLMKHHVPDEFTFRPAHDMERLEYLVVLPSGFEVCYEPLGLVYGFDEFRCACEVGTAGRIEVCLSVRNIGAGRRVGLVLDRREKNARRSGRAFSGRAI